MATSRCWPTSPRRIGASMIQAMVGRRISEIARPRRPQPSTRRRPRIRWIGAASGDDFQDVSVDVRRGEIVAIYGKLGSGAAEVGETAYGLRPITAGTLEVEGSRVTVKRPAPRGRGRRRLPPGRSQGRRRLHGPPGHGERGGRILGPDGGVRSVHLPPIRGEGVPALARQAVDPVAKRSSSGDGHAVRRQPAEGAARAMAGAQQPRARPHRADARRRRRRARRTSIARCGT